MPEGDRAGPSGIIRLAFLALVVLAAAYLLYEVVRVSWYQGEFVVQGRARPDNSLRHP